MPERGISYSPEIERPEKVSLNELFGAVRDRLKSFVSTLFNQEQLKMEGEEVEEVMAKFAQMETEMEVRGQHELGQQEAITVGREAAEFYRHLIPKALRQPNKEYTQPTPPSIFESNKDIGALHEKLRAARPDSHTANSVTTATLEAGQPLNGAVVSESPIEGGVFQNAKYKFVRDDGKTIIEEDVVNGLSEKRNIAFADLVWRDIQSGKKLDLNQLLPAEFKFIPADLRRYEDEIDVTSGKVIKMFLPVDLKSYQGTKGSAGSFYELDYSKRVAYGDLTKKGELLSLLHEISHSWQGVYYEDKGQGEFEEIRDHLGYLPAYVDLMRRRKESGQGQEDTDAALQYAKGKLAEVGVNIISEDIFATDKAPAVGEQKYTDSVTNLSFIVKSERLEQAVSSYEQDERDAWAHAIKVLRYLRSKGMDLEPELKTADDFKAHIDPCLESYQKNVGKKLELGKRKLKFIR